jgi:hypothetical protein
MDKDEMAIEKRIMELILPLGFCVCRMLDAGYTAERIRELVNSCIDEYENG